MPQPAFVQAGVETRATVSSGGVSGLTIPMPVGAAVGNFLMAVVCSRPSGAVPSNGISDDLWVVTGSGVWTELVNTQAGQGLGGNLVLYGKHCTGGEGNLSALLTAVGAGGNGTCFGNVVEFSNVRSAGYFEALHVTGQPSVSGPMFDADVAASAPKRLLVQIITAVGGGGFTGITGGGASWISAWSSTAVNPRMQMWTSTLGANGGAAATVGPAGGNSFTAVGFALAPCGNMMPNRMHHYVMMNGNS